MCQYSSLTLLLHHAADGAPADSADDPELKGGQSGRDQGAWGEDPGKAFDRVEAVPITTDRKLLFARLLY
jgi:hypothetical protein